MGNDRRSHPDEGPGAYVAPPFPSAAASAGHGSPSQIEALLELLLHPACSLDAAGNVRYLNRAWRQLAGVAATQPHARTWHELVSPKDHHLLKPPAHHDPLAIARFECRLKDASSGARWFLASLQRLSGTDGGGWLCTCADIHEFKTRELDLQARNQHQNHLLRVCEDCIKLISPNGLLLYMNRAGYKALGLAEDSPLGMAWLPLLPEEARAPGEQALAVARTGTPTRFIGCTRLPGQDLCVWENALTPIVAPEGHVTSILCTSRDVTAERVAQDALRQSQERLIVAARVGGLGIWDYDIAQDVLFGDETWHRIMGRNLDDPIHCLADFRPLIHPEDVERVTEVRETAHHLLEQDRDYAINFRIVRADGDIRWIRSAAYLIQNLAGEAVRAIGFVVDMTDTMRGEMALRNANRILEEERNSLAQQCLEDPLTRIANRRYLDSELAHVCRQANLRNDPLAVAMIDIDHFKSYNDRYGHLEGDNVLRRIAATLNAAARQSDFVARYGGEEFVFILHPVILTDPVSEFERLVASVEALNIPHEKSPYGRITISCGCAVLEAGSLEPAALLRAADLALYQAKAARGNRSVITRQSPVADSPAPHNLQAG